MDQPTNPISQPESVLPPPKQFLSEETLEEIWDARGMKYRVDEFHVALLNRGLGIYVDRPKFRKMVLGILKQFLVDGEARRQPQHEVRTRFPRVR